MSGLVEWRTPMDYGHIQDSVVELAHSLPKGMVVTYRHDGEIATCGAWLTCGGQNALRERRCAINWFEWAKTQNHLVVLEDALSSRYWIEGYSIVAHARLRREAGDVVGAKALLMSI